MRRTLVSAALISLLALPSAVQDGAKVKLEWKFKKGDTHRYEITTNIAIEMPGKAMSQDTILGLAMEVADVNAEGTGTIKATIDRLQYKMTLQSDAWDYDSDRDKKKADDSFVVKVLSSFVGKSMMMTLSRKGECLKVEGIDELLGAAVDEFPKGMKEVAAALKKSLSDDRMKGMMKMSMGCLPADPVGKGESWDGTASVSMGILGRLNTATKATLKDERADAGEATVGLDTKVTLEVGPDGWPVPKMQITDGKMVSEMIWLLDRGLMKSTVGGMKADLDVPQFGKVIAVSIKQMMKLAPRPKAAPAKEAK